MYQTMTDQETIEIRPQKGRQESFLASSADIVIYGGSAGGGKTWALLIDPLRDIDVKDFTALIFRRTYPEITNQGGLWDESKRLYPYAQGNGVEGNLIWKFPSGATVEFGHCQYDRDLEKYDGAQICDLMFDQLEHFTEKQFWYLCMRNRSTCGVPPRVRATCNPPDPTNPGSDWLPKFLSWWIADDGFANMERSGKIRWMVRWNDEIIWADTKQELQELYPALSPQSVTFIPATVYDNKILMDTDPNYIARLQALPYVERERFLGDRIRGGNWKISATAGNVFNMSWFDVVTAVPQSGLEARGFDLAATIQSMKNKDPDYTAGVKIRKVGNIYYVVDVLNDRYAAGEVEAITNSIIARDLLTAQQQGIKYRVRWEIEPGSAGLRETERLKRELVKKHPGLNCDGVPSSGDKISKAKGFAVAAQEGRVKVLAASWTDSYLSQLHGFPEKSHDDMVDASAIAYNAIFELTDRPEQKPQTNPYMQVGRI